MNQGAERRVLIKKTACKKSHATVPLSYSKATRLYMCNFIPLQNKSSTVDNLTIYISCDIFCTVHQTLETTQPIQCTSEQRRDLYLSAGGGGGHYLEQYFL